MVDRDRRDPSPVVDAGVEEPRELVVRQVRRRLKVNLRTKYKPGDGDRPQQLVEGRLGRLRHPGPGLRPEVLDDHLLQVTVPSREIADREQCVEPFGARLADSDQHAGGERDACLAGRFEGREPDERQLVGRAEVRAAALRQPLGRRLEHQPHRGADRPQGDEVGLREHAEVQMRQEPGFVEHGGGSARHIIDRRRATELLELVARSAVPELRLVAEREQRLAAPGRSPGARNLQDLVDRHVCALSTARRARERAVVADVATELRQRDEDFRRIRDERPELLRANPPRLGAQLFERRREEIDSLHPSSLERTTGRL